MVKSDVVSITDVGVLFSFIRLKLGIETGYSKTYNPLGWYDAKVLKEKLTTYSQTKDKLIKEEIINSQLKDILFLCLNYKTLHKDIEVQDLVQIASIGLIEAIEKFDEVATSSSSAVFL